MGKTGSVPQRYLPIFCQELYQLYRAGITPADGLVMLRDDETDEQILPVLNQLCQLTEDGMYLGEALQQSKAFPEYMTDMISLAENTGRLEDTLLALQHHYERSIRLRSEIQSAVTVPVVLLVVMIAVIVLLITQVLPVFDRVFAQLGVSMGGTAAAMMQVGTVLARAGTALAIVFALCIATAIVIVAVPTLRDKCLRTLQLHFGGRGIMGQLAVSRFASAMAMATASGMDMTEAVELSAKICSGAREIDEKTANCKQLMEDGQSPASALATCGLFAGRDCSLLELAERTGSLSETLEMLAGNQEEESLRHIDRLVGSIEPAIVLITSALAALILLSVMLPMMGLLSSI